MKVVILAGGFGTRLGEYTEKMPKPMVTIGNMPILWHIMSTFSYFGYNDFIIALGYKGHEIKKYFLEYKLLHSDIQIDLASGHTNVLRSKEKDWKVTLVDTGLKTMTGGRVKRLQHHLQDEPFLLTYGDGVADVNIQKLVKFHKTHGKMVTVTAVRPSARFGELQIEDGLVRTFKEKPRVTKGWINGGFFVMDPEFIDLIEQDQTVLEQVPLELAARRAELMAYKHEGFWQCMDTKRDLEELERLWSSGQAPWLFGRGSQC